MYVITKSKNFYIRSINCCPALLLEFSHPFSTFADNNVHKLSYLQRDVVVTILQLHIDEVCLYQSNNLAEKCTKSSEVMSLDVFGLKGHKKNAGSHFYKTI